MCKWGAKRNPRVGDRTGLFPIPTSPLTAKLGVEKSPFQMAVKRLQIDENVKRTRLKRHFLALNFCIEQSYGFRQSPK